MAIISAIKATTGEKKLFNKNPKKNNVSNILKSTIMIIGPRYFLIFINSSTSFLAILLIERAKKKGDKTTSVIKAAMAFPNLESSTKGKIYSDEINIIATIITECIMT